ncbi:hypothetical protein GF351_06260 [Candidatus Woesearchaeota archaeon]|nr:hypothetical protein [Candidatus Woesearchaeota archaeon]
MVSAVTIIWAFVITADIVFVFAGLYYLRKFLIAYQRGEDPSYHSGELMNAFVMLILLPAVVTGMGIRFAAADHEERTITMEMEQMRSPGGEIEVNWEVMQFSAGEHKEFILKIKNFRDQKMKVSVSVDCIGPSDACNSTKGMFNITNPSFVVFGKERFELPVHVFINTTEKSVSRHEIRVSHFTNSSLYATLPFNVIVE